MVSMGRSRLPPDSIRWRASLGMSSTSDTALSRMKRFTACISAATISRSGCRLCAGSRGSSNGTTTPKMCYPQLKFDPSRYSRQGQGAVKPVPRDRKAARSYQWCPSETIVEPMREVVRSNDAVMLSFAQAVLHEAGIYSLLADQHISVMEGAIGAFPRRLLVAHEDWGAAYQALSSAGLSASLMDEGDLKVCKETAAGPADVTDDAFLGGGLRVLQPNAGYRAGIDALLLAAAAPLRVGRQERVLDVGAGVGVVGLAVARRVPLCEVTLVEREPFLAELAQRNIAR